jgi:transposase-like protein
MAYCYGAKMRRRRRTHKSEFKAVVLLAAVQRDLTMAELGKKFDVHPNPFSEWKKQYASDRRVPRQYHREKFSVDDSGDRLVSTMSSGASMAAAEHAVRRDLDQNETIELVVTYVLAGMNVISMKEVSRQCKGVA